MVESSDFISNMQPVMFKCNRPSDKNLSRNPCPCSGLYLLPKEHTLPLDLLKEGY